MPESKKVSLTSSVCAIPQQVSRDLAGEAVILHMTSGVYYGLDAVGAHVWKLLQQPTTVQRLRDAILAEYEVEPQRCESDLLALLQRLAGEGLIEVRDEMAA